MNAVRHCATSQRETFGGSGQTLPDKIALGQQCQRIAGDVAGRINVLRLRLSFDQLFVIQQFDHFGHGAVYERNGGGCPELPSLAEFEDNE